VKIWYYSKIENVVELWVLLEWK